MAGHKTPVMTLTVCDMRNILFFQRCVTLRLARVAGHKIQVMTLTGV